MFGVSSDAVRRLGWVRVRLAAAVMRLPRPTSAGRQQKGFRSQVHVARGADVQWLLRKGPRTAKKKPRRLRQLTTWQVGGAASDDRNLRRGAGGGGGSLGSTQFHSSAQVYLGRRCVVQETEGQGQQCGGWCSLPCKSDSVASCTLPHPPRDPTSRTRSITPSALQGHAQADTRGHRRGRLRAILPPLYLILGAHLLARALHPPRHFPPPLPLSRRRCS